MSVPYLHRYGSNFRVVVRQTSGLGVGLALGGDRGVRHLEAAVRQYLGVVHVSSKEWKERINSE